jgi:penicillin amidase
MDLSRRVGAGELSALIGQSAVSHDLRQRLHRPRVRAQVALAQATAQDRQLIEAYRDGVNAGLTALGVRPPEYLALRASPEPWATEDVYLVAYAMIDDLHDVIGFGDYRNEALRSAFSPGLASFLESPDVTWSAALDDSVPEPARSHPSDAASRSRRSSPRNSTQRQQQLGGKRKPWGWSDHRG